MADQGLRIHILASAEDFSDQSEADKYVVRLAAIGVVHSMEFYDLPGECDAQRADRLAGELSTAKAKIGRLEAAAKPKRKKPKTKGKKGGK